MLLSSSFMMDIKTFRVCLILLTSVFAGAQEARIFPYSTATVLEGENLTVSCTWIGSEDVIEVLWNENGNYMGSISKQCDETGELSTATNYSVECRGNNSFTITLKNVQRNMQYHFWNCVMVTSGYNKTSERTRINKIGISSVTMLTPTPLKVLADTNVSLHCQATAGRPSADMHCSAKGGIGFGYGHSADNYSVDGLMTTLGTLTLTPTSENNTVVVYCTASNVGPEFNTSEVIIDVLHVYSPEEPECQHRGEIVKGVIRIQEANELCVTCTSRSNPPAYYYNWTTSKNMSVSSSTLCIPDAQMDDSGSVPQPQSNQTMWIAGGVIGGLVGTIMFAAIAICNRKYIRTRKNVSPHE